MRVYPWRQRNNQGDRRLIMKVVTSTAVFFRVVGGVLSIGLASLLGAFLVHRFAVRNDSWAKRGAALTGIGLLLFLILGGFPSWVDHLNTLLLSFGDKATSATLPAATGFLLRSVPLSFVFQGVAVMMDSYAYEITGDRYLERVVPTRKMQRRRKKNEAALVNNDKPHEDSIAFGVIVDDPIPWRTARHGMICARPFHELGHGAIFGSNATGKTVLAISLAFQEMCLDAAVFYVDFKASKRTLESMKKAAAKAGKKFYSFDLGTGSSETSWYDPLDWKGTSSEKAAMVVNSLSFTEDGSAAYYRGQANDWLIFQFDVIAEVGLYPGESSFDFLLATSNPATMKDRLRVLKTGDARQQELFAQFMSKADMFKPQDLSALRQNLSIVVNSGGERLRPQTSAPAILMSRAVEEGAVVYFGLSPSTDQVALKAIGSLILRNLDVLSGERMRDPNVANLRPLVAFVDEASRLQDRAVVMDNLFTTAREGHVYLWVITQSVSTWPESTMTEMNSNVLTYVAFRIQDADTAEFLLSSLEDVPVLEEMVEDQVRHRAGRGDVKERSGDARTTLTTGPFLSDAPMKITTMENLYAYVWFMGTWDRATIEEWTPKRLKKPDTIRNDAPLVHIQFMDYDTDAEPIRGSSFSELVTSADEITYHMENTTLKRTRQVSLTDEDYDAAAAAGAAPEPQWTIPVDEYHEFGSSGSGEEQGKGMGVRSGGGEGLSWGDEPRWDTGAQEPVPMPGPDPVAEGPVWGSGGMEWDDDQPPAPVFLKPGQRMHAEPAGEPVVAEGAGAGSAPVEGSVKSSPAGDDLVWDEPEQGGAPDAQMVSEDAVASAGGEAPVGEVESAPAPEEDAPVESAVEGFAPETPEGSAPQPQAQSPAGEEFAPEAEQDDGGAQEPVVTEPAPYTGGPSQGSSAASPSSPEPSQVTPTPIPERVESSVPVAGGGGARGSKSGARQGPGPKPGPAKGAGQRSQGSAAPKRKKNASDDWL